MGIMTKLPASPKSNGWTRKADGKLALSIWGEHREVNPPARIVHTENMQMGPGGDVKPWELLATLELVEQAKKTYLTMKLLFSTKEVRDAALASGMEHGVAAGYNTLDGILVELSR
jgi:uncharacterized protein YndB with AHSA1/START domain